VNERGGHGAAWCAGNEPQVATKARAERDALAEWRGNREQPQQCDNRYMRDMFATQADPKLQVPRRQENPMKARFGIAALRALAFWVCGCCTTSSMH
jgi:hypothetical protein